MAYKRQIETNNAMAHLQGQYILEAVATVMSDKHKYPEKPYDLNLDGKKQEREKESQIELFASNLTTMMHNFNLSKEQG